jgi:dienelactone hydrolase
MVRVAAFVLLLATLSGCGVEETLFPFLDPQPLAEPPAPLGPYAFTERSVQVDDLGDGGPGGITIFEPVGAEGSRPTLVWVLGVNNRPYYHQSFHEYMASWGYIEVVPDTRPISFLDSQYNKRNVDIAVHAFSLAAGNAYGLASDTQKIAFGGYSAGGSMAAFAAGLETRAKALVMWAPAPAWRWAGVDPGAILPAVQAPSLFLLAGLGGDTEWHAQMQALMGQSQQTVTVIENGVHLWFQEPDPPPSINMDPPTTLTRQEQMAQALPITRAFLDDKMAVTH